MRPSLPQEQPEVLVSFGVHSRDGMGGGRGLEQGEGDRDDSKYDVLERDRLFSVKITDH